MSKPNFTITVPAGTYYIGDPCYVVPDDKWLLLLEAADYFDDPSKPYGTVNGYKVYASSTCYGDGNYLGSDGNYYPVDSGLIGIVPVAIAKEPEPFGVQRVTFNRDFNFVYRDGIIVIDDVEIDTYGYDDDYDDDYDVDYDNDYDVDTDRE